MHVFVCSGALSALERCLLEGPGRLSDAVDHSLVVEVLGLLENVSLLLLGVLYGAQENQHQENGTPGTGFNWDWMDGCRADVKLSSLFTCTLIFQD